MNYLLSIILLVCCLAFGIESNLYATDLRLRYTSEPMSLEIKSFSGKVALKVVSSVPSKLIFSCDMECKTLRGKKEGEYLIIVSQREDKVVINSAGYNSFHLNLPPKLKVNQEYRVDISSLNIKSSDFLNPVKVPSARSAGFNEGSAGGGDGIGDMLGGLLGASSTKKSRRPWLIGSARAPRSRDLVFVNENVNRPKADIMRVLRRRTPDLRHVLKKYLGENPGFGGKLDLEIRICSCGEVSEIKRLGSTTRDSNFDTEVMEKVKQWNFGLVESGSTTIIVPFRFSE